MRTLTRLLVVACGYAVLAPVTAAAQVPPAPTPRQVEEVTINFTPGSARLSNIAKAKLDEVALMMKQDPDLRAQSTGYTTSGGTSESNQALSEQRASATKNYLVTRHGIDPARIVTEGKGASGKGNVAIVVLSEL